jgi:hypothetical protein
MQGRKLIALGGAALFLLGCVGFAAGLYVFWLGFAASELDGLHGLIIGPASSGSKCKLEDVTPPTRTPVIGESFKLSLKFGNNVDVLTIKENDQNCERSVYTDAPGFEIGDNPRHFKIPPGQSEQFVVIEAKNAGTHEIVISSDSENRVIGLHVLSNPFFSPSQMFVISGFLALLGPMAALPWWIGYLRSRGQRPLKSKKSAS